MNIKDNKELPMKIIGSFHTIYLPICHLFDTSAFEHSNQGQRRDCPTLLLVGHFANLFKRVFIYQQVALFLQFQHSRTIQIAETARLAKGRLRI